MSLKSLFLSLFLIGNTIGGAIAQHDPTHFVQTDGSIWDYRDRPQGGNRPLFKVTVPVEGFVFTQSDQGKLLYLERPKEPVTISVEGYAPPNQVIYILHVCDKDVGIRVRLSNFNFREPVHA